MQRTRGFRPIEQELDEIDEELEDEEGEDEIVEGDANGVALHVPVAQVEEIFPEANAVALPFDVGFGARNQQVLQQLDWKAYAMTRRLQKVMLAWQRWKTVPGVFRQRQVKTRVPRIIMPLKEVKTVQVAKVVQGERTGPVDNGGVDIDKAERKRVMRINRIANIWKRFARAISWRDEKKEKKKKQKTAAAVTQTQKDFKEKKPGNNEQGYNACKERAPGRYVIPMRAAHFLPGEETGAQQFGISGKGRFFTAGIFFERLEMQGSKRARQVRKQVDADWSSRAKLTRRWTNILQNRRRVRVRKVDRARTWGSEISWASRRKHIVLLKGMKLPVWIPFIVDESIGYINSEPHTAPYILWGDPLSGRSCKSAAYVAYNWPWRGNTQREGYPFYTQQPYKYLGLRNRRLAMQEGVIIPPWTTRAMLPTHPTLRTHILWLFNSVEEHSAIKVWAIASQTWERTRIQQQVIPGHQKQLFTEEQRETLQELDKTPRVVWQFLWRSQQKKQAAVLRAWQDYTRLVRRLLDIPQTATTARASMDRLRELNQIHNTWRWNRRRQEVAFGEWKWTVELVGMARMTADVRFDEFNLQLSEEAFEQWAAQVPTLDYSLPIILSDLLRRKALVETTFEAWATLTHHKALTKAAFRAWSRENNPPWELDWDVIEARGAEIVYYTDRGYHWDRGWKPQSETAAELLLVWAQRRKIYNYYRQRLTKTVFEEWVIAAEKPLKLTEAQLGQLGFKTLDLDQQDFRQWDLDPNDQYDSEQPGLVTTSSESEDDWPLPRLPDRSGEAVGWNASDYVTDHWSPMGPTNPRGMFAPTGLQPYSLTVHTPAGTFDGNESKEGLLRLPLPQRLDRIQAQQCRQALQAWQQVLRKRKQQAAGANDSEEDQYDSDSNDDSGGDSSDDDNEDEDQHKSRHDAEAAAHVHSSPAANHADHLTRPMKPASFGSILRQLFEGQQPLPWAPHPLSAFMNTEAYRRFSYCASSGEYTAFEVSGDAAVYLASFTANVQPGVRLWLVDSGSSCFVTPFRDTMILPIRTELQMNGIGGAHSKMVSPLILSFLDADGEYAVLHFQCVFLLETLPIPLFATGPCEQQGWGFSLNASSPCATMPDGRCVPLFRDRVTGFHWIPEHLQALPTIKGRRAVVSKCLEQSNQAGIELEYIPALNCAKQRTRLEDAESLPTEPFSQYRYDRMMASQHPLGGGKQRAHAITAVNTRAQLNDARRQQNEKEHEDLMQTAWKNLYKKWDEEDAVKGRSRWLKPEPKAEVKSEEKYESFQEEDEWQEVIEKEKDAGTDQTEVKQESDDSFFKKEKMEKRSSPQSRPLRLRIPRTRWLDTNQPQDTQKASRFIHEALGHLSMATIKEGLKVVKGYESIANIIEVMPDDRHCNACAIGKSKMPAIPKGKTVRLTPVRKDLKLFVDLSGHIEEPSIWHNFHYYISACTQQGFSYIRGLRSRSQALLALAQIFAECGNPKEVQIDGEGGLSNDIASDFFAVRGIHVIKTEAYAHFRNGKIERRHQTWKGMCRAMLNRAGMSIAFWWFAMRQAVLISNLILLETQLDGSEPESRRSIWEAHFGETPHLDSYVLDHSDVWHS